jgi:hypothetical protein
MASAFVHTILERTDQAAAHFLSPGAIPRAFAETFFTRTQVRLGTVFVALRAVGWKRVSFGAINASFEASWVGEVNRSIRYVSIEINTTLESDRIF